MCARLMGQSPSCSAPYAICGHDGGHLCFYDLRASSKTALMESRLHEKSCEIFHRLRRGSGRFDALFLFYNLLILLYMVLVYGSRLRLDCKMTIEETFSPPCAHASGASRCILNVQLFPADPYAVLCVDIGSSCTKGVSGSADDNIHVFGINLQKVRLSVIPEQGLVTIAPFHVFFFTCTASDAFCMAH